VPIFTWRAEQAASIRKLTRASKDCKNAFAKGKRSFDVLEAIDPAVLNQHLPSFVRVDRILKAKF